MSENHEARELEMFIANDYPLYGQTKSILKNLATKKARGVYKHDLAVKLFMYLVEAGAKKYAKDFSIGTDWHTMFNVPTRKLIAESLAKNFEEEYKTGNYADLLPKKYQPKPKAAKATKKSPAQIKREVDAMIGKH
jgi:hypothetical protein